MSDNEIKLLEIFAEQLCQPFHKLSKDLQRIAKQHFFNVEWDNFSAYERLKKLKEIDDLKESSEQNFYFKLVFLNEWLETEYQSAQKKGNDSRALAFTEMQTKIKKFESIHKTPASNKLGERERNSLLRVIGSLLETLLKDLRNEEGNKLITNQSELISYLEKHYEGYEGVSKSNLEKQFPLAMKLL